MASAKPTQIIGLKDIKVFGELGVRIRRALDHVLSWRKTKTLLHSPPAEYRWSADFQGRWTQVISTWHPYFRWKDCGIRKVLDVMMKGQQANGSFGKPNDYFVRFGNGRGIVGLLASYEQSRDQACLESAAKAGLWFHEKLLDKDRYPKKALYCASPCSALAGLVKLWALTSDKRFAAISTSMAERTIWIANELLTGNIVQAHMFLMSIKGLHDLYQHTGKKRYLDTVLRIWTMVHDKEAWLSGGMPEFFTTANDQVDEGCANADWVSLNLALWRDTKDTKYLDAAERTLYNQIYNNQIPNGGISGSCNLEQGFRASESWFCCSMHVPAALANFVRHTYGRDGNTIYVNQFFPNKVQLSLSDGTKVLIRQTTSYPRKGQVKITVCPQSPTRFTLAVRLPRWLDNNKAVVTLNGTKSRSSTVRKHYLRIDRRWKDGDVVELDFAFAMRAQVSTTGQHPALGKVAINRSRPVKAKLIGVFRGPLLLATFRPDHNNDITWIYRGGYNEVQESGGVYGQWNQSWRDAIRRLDKQYSSTEPVALTSVSVEQNRVVLAWRSRLNGRMVIDNEVRVFPTLPVCIEHQETAFIPGQDGAPVRHAYLCGSRLAIRKAQRHDHYPGAMRIFRYEYPASAPQAKVNGRKVLTARILKVTKNQVRYTFSNSIFCIEATSRGDIKGIKIIRKKDWTGVYLCPKFRPLEKPKGRVALIVTRSTYPFPEFRDRVWKGEGKSYGSIQFLGR